MFTTASLLLFGCAAPASPPESGGHDNPDWSLAGCTITEHFVFPRSGSPQETCVRALFGDVYTFGEWQTYAHACHDAAGGWSSLRATFTPEGCMEDYEYEYVDVDRGLEGGERRESECDAHGEPTATAWETWTFMDGRRVSWNERAEFANTYDDRDRLILQDATTVRDDAYDDESRAQWTYDAGRLVRWREDVDYIESDFSTTSSIDYAYDTRGNRTEARQRDQTNRGDDDTRRYTYDYDDENRLIRRERDDGEDGIVDGSADFSWVGNTPRSAGYSEDYYGYGVADKEVQFDYACP